PLFDGVLMGVGVDGHAASLFPGRAELEESERWVVGVAEAGLEPFVPRVTLTFPALASTREMLFIVSGSDKREVLARVSSGADLPATRAYAEGDLVWLVDRDAAPEHRDVARAARKPIVHRGGDGRIGCRQEHDRSLAGRSPGLGL